MNEDPRVDLASLYRELMDDPLRVAGPGEHESDRAFWDSIDVEPTDEPVPDTKDDAPFDSFERRDRLNDRMWEEDDVSSS